MKRGYFVTGTGTGVGKTFVTAMLARQAVAAGERVFAFKPIETGCPLVAGDPATRTVKEPANATGNSGRRSGGMGLVNAVGGRGTGHAGGISAEDRSEEGRLANAARGEGNGNVLANAFHGKRIGEDQELLAKAAGDWQRGDLRNLYCFERPLAPCAAARFEGRTIDLFHVERTFVRGADGADLCLVEGAGGWRVPITEREDMASLARRLDLPVVIVGLATLGTINHCLLTIEAVRGDGCEVAEVVLSRRGEDDLRFARDNASEIRRLSGCAVRLTDDLASP